MTSAKLLLRVVNSASANKFHSGGTNTVDPTEELGRGYFQVVLLSDHELQFQKIHFLKGKNKLCMRNCWLTFEIGVHALEETKHSELCL